MSTIMSRLGNLEMVSTTVRHILYINYIFLMIPRLELSQCEFALRWVSHMPSCDASILETTKSNSIGIFQAGASNQLWGRHPVEPRELLGNAWNICRFVDLSLALHFSHSR